jgi:hypothetical protein
MILTLAYFNGDLFIDSLTGSQPVQLSVQSKVTSLIGKHENEFLYLILGEMFAKEFLAGIAGHLPAAIPAPWKALYDKLFTTQTDGTTTFYYSVVANYVFNFYLRSLLSMTTTSGEGKAKIDGMENVSNWDKIIANWNSMVDQLWVVWDFLHDNAATYTTYKESEVDGFIGEKLTIFQ